MDTIALIEKGSDGRYGIYTPDIEHTIIGAGDSVSEAKIDFENSVNEMIASYKESNRTLPTELQGIRFIYKYDLASLFNFYSFINVSGFAKIAGINSSLMRQYKTGKVYISEAQISKIETAFNKIGNEMSAVKLL